MDIFSILSGSCGENNRKNILKIIGIFFQYFFNTLVPSIVLCIQCELTGVGAWHFSCWHCACHCCARAWVIVGLAFIIVVITSASSCCCGVGVVGVGWLLAWQGVMVAWP